MEKNTYKLLCKIRYIPPDGITNKQTARHICESVPLSIPVSDEAPELALTIQYYNYKKENYYHLNNKLYQPLPYKLDRDLQDKVIYERLYGNIKNLSNNIKYSYLYDQPIYRATEILSFPYDFPSIPKHYILDEEQPALKWIRTFNDSLILHKNVLFIEVDTPVLLLNRSFYITFNVISSHNQSMHLQHLNFITGFHETEKIKDYKMQHPKQFSIDFKIYNPDLITVDSELLNVFHFLKSTNIFFNETSLFRKLPIEHCMLFYEARDVYNNLVDNRLKVTTENIAPFIKSLQSLDGNIPEGLQPHYEAANINKFYDRYNKQSEPINNIKLKY